MPSTAPAVPSRRNDPEPERPWHAFINIDVFLTVLYKTFLHPFIACLIPLCLRAQVTPYDHPSFIISTGYAILLTLGYILAALNRRIAYGLPREVDFEEEVIVIAGGAGGLGGLVANVFALKGATVAILDIEGQDSDAANEAEEKSIEYYQCDVSDRKQVESAKAKIEKELGTVTVLINAAAVAPMKPLLEMSGDEVDRALRVNLLSHYNTIQAFLPGMLEEDRGTIVTVSSVLAHIGAANLSAYSPAKAALHNLHQTITAELKQNPRAENIRTVLVAPGQMTTQLFRNVKTPSQFFAPILEPVSVANEIVNIIDSGASGEIVLPFYARWIEWFKVMPVSMQQMVRWMSGVDRAGFFAYEKAKVGSGKNGK